MTGNSWYRVERILSEKHEQKGSRLEKFYEILWAPTWEPAKRIKAQVPQIVEEYEKTRNRKRPPKTGYNEPSTKQIRLSVQKKIKILGIARDNGRSIENSTMLVENVHSGERYCMQYEEIKTDYPMELIQFFEECICGFTK